MVYRVYVEKKQGLDAEAKALRYELRHLLGLKEIEDVRIINRYDVENISAQLFGEAVKNVLSEVQLDDVSASPDLSGGRVFAVEYLPGQFDQRADSAAQCIQLLSCGDRPTVRTAKVYVLIGDLSQKTFEKVKKHVINPVEAREASLEAFSTLETNYAVPTEVEVLKNFISLSEQELQRFVEKYGLAMEEDDLAFCRDYFRSEHRDPTLTEIRMIDTYWSDHCRHTTFLTELENVRFEDAMIAETYRDYLRMRAELGVKKPVTLMDLATVSVKALKKQGKLPKLDESEEINACTVKIEVETGGKKEPWLLLFKNETHNHPTEIEPFGGAATCIGGAIRDPLSGRAYVYGAMRVTGAADPLKKVSETIEGKLPQRKIVTTAAAGYSSYGNQIGLATGIVDEIYDPGYAAKRMEIGAVIAAVPEKNVRRECPLPGDQVILIGGRTGRDGCGGATGSSKAHTQSSLETCGAEVQKGNAPEERKLQRFFRNAEAVRMIKRCNDFGAGGVSVAIGELADGLSINLNAVPKKYDGLDGTELAISESQERMAVVVAPADVKRFLALADSENLEATVVASVTEKARLVMTWNGKTIVDIAREFLNSNGAKKKADAYVVKTRDWAKKHGRSFAAEYLRLAGDLNVCSKRGLSERFDSTIGAGTVLMPFGGKNQRTPIEAMVQKISLESGTTDDCSLMAWGFDPVISKKSPYHGAYLAVVSSLCKLIASGADFNDVYLTFQEYFPRPNKDEKRWGLPLAALLGAFRAQNEFGVGAIGGKDSMSGSFEQLDVPPTLVSFAVTTAKTGDVLSPEFKKAGDKVVLLAPEIENNLPKAASQIAVFNRVTALIREKKAVAVWSLAYGGAAEGVLKMCLGNGFGFAYEKGLTADQIFEKNYGSFLIELSGDENIGVPFGCVTAAKTITREGESVSLEALSDKYEGKLESVYACNIKQETGVLETVTDQTPRQPKFAKVLTAKPTAIIPVFPGTNCEYDSRKAVEEAGGNAEITVLNNLSADGIARSIEAFSKKLAGSQMIFLPGGFSGGDEPDGSGKFITAFFRSAAVKEGVTKLLDERNGLIIGICNGFQALIKLGLVPYGRIVEPSEEAPTLTFNRIARHQSKIVRVRVASTLSPWLSFANVGEVYNVPISHGEGRFFASDEQIQKLIAGGQIATQYVDFSGEASGNIDFNPNGSVLAVEGISSPDGRVFGKMGHAERVGSGLYQNVPGNYDMKLFEAAVRYFHGFYIKGD